MAQIQSLAREDWPYATGEVKNNNNDKNKFKKILNKVQQKLTSILPASDQ